MIWISHEKNHVVDSILSKEIIARETYVRVKVRNLHRLVPIHSLASDAPRNLKNLIAKAPIVETPRGKWIQSESDNEKYLNGENVLERMRTNQGRFFCLHDRFGRSYDLTARTLETAKKEADIHLLTKAPVVSDDNELQKARVIIHDLIQMLVDWNNNGDGMSGFADFEAVRQAEKFLDGKG